MGSGKIDKTSGLDRALCYPGFFPKFSAQLSAARDAASSGVINADTLLTYYTRGTRRTDAVQQRPYAGTLAWFP